MTSDYRSLDALVRARLREWPQRPPGIPDDSQGCPDGWLRGRPSAPTGSYHPYLKLPGSDRYRTLPDGLWLNFGGTPADPYVDIFAIEACGSMQNLLDKRSRFAPSTNSMLAVCPVPWLLAAVDDTDSTPRWQVTGLLRAEPIQPLILPVRDVRVLYGLKTHHYQGFARNQIPQPHEYFAPMDALTAQGGHEDPAMQALVARASTSANFLTAPGAQASRSRDRSHEPNVNRSSARSRRGTEQDLEYFRAVAG